MSKSVFSKNDSEGNCYDVIETNSVVIGQKCYIVFYNGVEVHDPQRNEENAIALANEMMEEFESQKGEFT